MESSSRAFDGAITAILTSIVKERFASAAWAALSGQSHQWLNGKILLSRSRAMSAMAGSATSPILARWGGMALDLGDE
ncbi:MAG TPA: hypothetical protein VHQ22_06585 [Terriglobales bacterium]|jgi:hypothetical protein|nr:hypothetical protein [Terriglobales bacterium]